MSTWHVDATVVTAYGERRLDPVQRASVEAHADRCATCRTALGAGALGLRHHPGDPGTPRTGGGTGTATGLPGGSSLDLDSLWSRVEAEVTAPRIGRIGRALLRLGASMADLVVMRAVAAQSRQWTLATTLVLAVTAVAAVLGPVDSAHAAFLVVAPLLPALGVAATYRLVPHGVDLLERTAPYSPARLLLWRTAYVVVTAVPVAAVAGALVLRHPGAAVGWLLPALACTLCVAVAATWHDPARPAAVVALGWTAVVVTWQIRDTPWAITTAPTQLTAVAVSLAAAVLLHRRLDAGSPTGPIGPTGPTTPTALGGP